MRLASLLGGLLVLAGFVLASGESDEIGLAVLLLGAAIEVVVAAVTIVPRLKGWLVDPRRELDRYGVDPRRERHDN